MSPLQFADPAGMHFTQQQCQDVLDFAHAALQLSNHPKGRSGLLVNLNSKPGSPEVANVGHQFDAALSKLMAHFGVTLTKTEPKAKKAGSRS